MTNSAKYQVIVLNLRKDVDINTIEHCLIAEFNATPAFAKVIVAHSQAGQSMTVKRDITHAEAEQFCQRLESLGLICSVQEEWCLVDIPTEEIKEQCICPACGHKQVKSTQGLDQCERCGVVHQNYEALLARKQLIEAEKQRIRQRSKGAREYRRQKEIMKKEMEQEKAIQSQIESAHQEANRQIRKELGLTGLGYLRAMIAAAGIACYRLRVRAATASTSSKLLAGFLSVGMLFTGYVLYTRVLNPPQTDLAETSHPITPPPVTATQDAMANPPPGQTTDVAEISQSVTPPPVIATQGATANPLPEQTQRDVTKTTQANIPPTVTGDARPLDSPQGATANPPPGQTQRDVTKTAQANIPPTVTGDARPLDSPQGATVSPLPEQTQRGVTKTAQANIPPTVTGDARPLDSPAAVSVTIATNLAKVGQVEAAQQELAGAIRHAQSKQNLSKSELDIAAFGQAEIFGSLGVQQFRQGNSAASSKSLAQASHVAHSIYTPVQRAIALSDTAVHAASAGNTKLANELFAESLKTAEEFPTTQEQIEVRIIVAQGIAQSGDPQGAHLIFSQVEKQIQRLTDPVDHIVALGILARSRAEIGDTLIARQILDKAHAKSQTLDKAGDRTRALRGLHRQQAEAHGAMARTLSLQGDLIAGQQWFTQALQEAQSLTTPGERAVVLSSIARQLAQAGQQDLSDQTFAKAIAIVAEGQKSTNLDQLDKPSMHRTAGTEPGGVQRIPLTPHP